MSTTNKNRSILAGLVGDPPVTVPPNTAATPARVADRLSGLARVTSSDYSEKTFQLVDPARCRMWARHNRLYDLLTPESCADLLESLRAQGVQEFPAVVRRIEGDPDHDWEVICGARRHWSVSYLRKVEHRDIKFLVDERELTDEQAFRVSDLENRTRKDISDYERALDYQGAVAAFYGGVATRMADRLEISKGWLSRLLDLAKLPHEIIQAFGDVRLVKEFHARELKPLLVDAASGARVLSAASDLVRQQEARRAAGQPPIEPARVMAALKGAVRSSVPRDPAEDLIVRSPDGVALFSVKRKPGKRAVLELDLGAKATDEDFIAAFTAELPFLRRPR